MYLDLTQTINESETQIVNLQRDLDTAQKELTKMNTRLSSAEATWQTWQKTYIELLLTRSESIRMILRI